MDHYKGRIAIVTGAASGIGEATARALAAAGAIVIAADIADFNSRLDGHIGQVEKARLDVAATADWETLMTQTMQRHGRLDLLVNCAGILVSGGIEDVTPDSLMQVLDVNTKGIFAGCRAAIAVMKGQETPSAIVNIASANAIKAQSWTCAYAASKAAALSLTRTTALHCAEAGYNIRVNAILPGIVATPMVETLLAQSPDPEAARKQLAGFHPIGRLLDAREIASVVLFLGSPAASGITGAAISVDGGMTAF